MRIKEQLRLVGNDCDNQIAVMVEDEGEEFPLFFESLHNTVYFPLMLESGYTLAEYPYTFMLDGRSILDLPVRAFTPSDKDLQYMYDSIGTKMPEQEIKNHIVAPIHTIETPPAEYVIHTREEFLAYLDAAEKVRLATDFKPINYFVAPEARFGMEEYRSPEFARYVSIMGARRRMSVHTFDKLIEWLLEHGLRPNYTLTDVLDAYFAWGVDGLNAAYIDKYRTKQDYTLLSDGDKKTPTVKVSTGFIDKAGNLLTPMSQRGVAWSLSATGGTASAQMVQDKVRGIQEGEALAIDVYARASVEVIVLEAPSFTVRISGDTLLIGKAPQKALSVVDPTSSGSVLDLEMALPNNREALKTYVTLMALARQISDARRSRYMITSKDVLKLIGLDPSEILHYFINSSGGNSSSGLSMSNGDETVTVSTQDVANYLHGDNVDADSVEVIEDILSGVTNVGGISTAMRYEAMNSAWASYKTLYALHHVFGFSLEEIYERIRTADKEAVFMHDGLTVRINLEESKLLYNAYMQDITENEIIAADSCYAFYMVTKIAREVGNDNCRRHVGFEGYRVIRNKTSDALLSKLIEDYKSACEYGISNASDRAEALKKAAIFAEFAFFEAALKGRVTMPPYLGGNIISIPSDRVAAYRSCIVPVIESTAAYCNRQLDESGRAIRYNAYCVNAYITPEYVIPRPGQSIKEYPFYTLWRDWSKQHEVYSALIKQGVLDGTFIPWEYRYCDCGFNRRSGTLDAKDSLHYYFNKSRQFTENFVPGTNWTSVTHPEEMLYPKLYENDLEESDETTISDKANVRLGLVFTRKFSDYKDIVLPLRSTEVEDQYIRRFIGFHAEELISNPDIATAEPDTNKKVFFVHRASGTICPIDGSDFIDFSRLTEFDDSYSYIHVYGRKYLLRDVNDVLWEVRI